MRQPLSLKKKVNVYGRRIDLLHTDVASTFRRERQRLAEQQKKVTPIRQRKTA